MSSITLLRPEIKKIEDVGAFHARIVIEPLNRGFGHTLGCALRRVMLSSIPGFAPTEAKVTGVVHEYDHLEGVREDVVWIMLNLKGVVFKLNDVDWVTARLAVDRPGAVTAGDFSLPHNVEVVNPDHVIANVAKGGKLEMEVVVESGVGYQPAAQRRIGSKRGGVVYLDASFSPVRRVGFEVQSARVEDRADLDRLILDIHTNGVFSCEEIVRYAARQLTDQLSPFARADSLALSIESVGKSEQAVAANASILGNAIEDLNLTVRSQNCLKQSGISHIGDLVRQQERDLLLMPNLGRKSLVEIKQALASFGIELGMDIGNWRPQGR